MDGATSKMLILAGNSNPRQECLPSFRANTLAMNELSERLFFLVKLKPVVIC